MTATKYEVRAGAYYDSVVLMQLQKNLAALEGVLDAGVVMATPANKEVLVSTGFEISDIEAKADDLLIIVKGESATAAESAIAQVNELLKQRQAAGGPSDFRPKSLASAVKMLPEAEWVLISVPGRYAAGVAEEALDLGKHVFLYSDNVSVEDEVKLKQKAQAKGLLVMGPDCGTAVINGIGLGFANHVRRGNIGVVGASGTGIQAITAEVHNLGGGISQAIGTGGRDLKEAVGGITAAQGLRTLAADEQTKIIVLVSKPPSPQIAAELLAIARQAGKPVIVNFIGYPPPARRIGNLYFALNLHDAAAQAIRIDIENPAVESITPRDGYLRGLFSGGTLAYETLLGLQTTLNPLYANIPIRPEQKLADVWHSQAHTIIDMGEDEFTQGRLHPMMDNDLRLRRLRQEGADAEVGLILLDVVLGEGAHLDPAAEIAPVIAQIKEAREVDVVVMAIGTDDDPQDMQRQIGQLEAAGALVFRTAHDAVNYVSQRLYSGAAEEVPAVVLGDSLAAVNVGLESFYDSLTGQGAAAVQVEWRPPAGGNEKLMAILAKMKKKT